MILFTTAVTFGGRKYLAGTAAELDGDAAEKLIRKGYAVRMEPEFKAEAEKSAPIPEPETDDASDTEADEGLTPEEVDTEAKLPEADEAEATVIRKGRRPKNDDPV